MQSIHRRFRPTILNDFLEKSYDDLDISSYKHAAYPLGCSPSECELSLDEREITLLQEQNHPIAFVRVKSATQKHLFFDLYCNGNTNDSIAPLEAVLSHLLKTYPVRKFFVQLFEHEAHEKALLAHCGFEEEARLIEQVWLQGKYQNIIIMGSPLDV